jgi:hypothetical protein
MKNLITALFVLCYIPLQAQVANEFKAADVIALNAPDTCQFSINSLGRYLSSAFRNPAFRARAIYTWTALNISYDLANMGKVNAATPFDELVSRTMQTHTAICQGYVSVFKALCDVCGIDAFIIQGYTRQNGHINELSHAWIIAMIDSSWYGFDPTWGAGYMINGSYKRFFNDQFFMIKPEILIQDHMPFDPIWECLISPVNNKEFISGKASFPGSHGFFAYADSIRVYNSLNSKDQCSAALRRLESAGIINNLLAEWSNYLRDCIANEKHNADATEKNKYVKQFNDAVASYNNCIYAFNQYVDYWNRQFTPLKPEPVIVDMLNLCYTYLDSSKSNLAGVIAGDPEMKQSTDQLRVAIDVAQENLDKQKVFLKIYFNTDPQSRPLLFKKYNKSGLPVLK